MENISVFDIFKIGIGPSSSHTLGPWIAALSFADQLDDRIDYVKIDLFGSLSKTGKGHGTDIAVILGLQSFDPKSIPVDLIKQHVNTVRVQKEIKIGGNHIIPFNPDTDISFRRETDPAHPNTLTFRAFANGILILEETYYSVGGGFILRKGDPPAEAAHQYPFPHSCHSEDDLLTSITSTNKRISDLVWENERSIRSESEVKEKLRTLWDTMLLCIYRGCHTEGILPGGLNVQRRAFKLHQNLRPGLK